MVIPMVSFVAVHGVSCVMALTVVVAVPTTAMLLVMRNERSEVRTMMWMRRWTRRRHIIKNTIKCRQYST